MKWALVLIGLTVFAVVAWAAAPLLIALAMVGALSGWLAYLVSDGAPRRLRRWWRDRHLRRGARQWAKARRERERRQVESL